MFRRIVRRRVAPVLGLAAVCATLVGGSSPAMATTDQFSGHTYIQGGGAWLVGQPHTLNDVGVSGAGPFCANAINYYGGDLAGNGMCNYGSDTVVIHHPFCACALRDGTVYGAVTGYVALIDWATESY